MVKVARLSHPWQFSLKHFCLTVISDFTSSTELILAEALDQLKLFDHLGQFQSIDISGKGLLLLLIL